MGNRNYSLNISKKQGNVRVTRKADKDGSCLLTISLHGHEVFKADYGKRWFSFNTCGYYTASTRDVINTALRELRPDMHVFRQAHIWRVSFGNGLEEAHLETCENKKYEF